MHTYIHIYSYVRICMWYVSQSVFQCWSTTVSVDCDSSVVSRTSTISEFSLSELELSSRCVAVQIPSSESPPCLS